MKKYSIMILVIFFLWIYGCSEDSTTGPEEDANYNLETSETIGTAGGTVEIDDFSLSVPAGAFESDQTIEVYTSSDDLPLGDDQVTRTFRIEGIPECFSQPILVSLTYEGTLSGETYIAQGIRSFDEYEGDTTTVYNLQAASDSLGKLHCEFPPMGGSEPLFGSGSFRTPRITNRIGESIKLLGLKDQGKRETEHFIIKYPVDLIDVNINSVGTMLEVIYDTITVTMQLSWPWLHTHVYIGETDPERIVDGAIFEYETGHQPVLIINRHTLSQGDFTSVRDKAGVRFLSWILSAYDSDFRTPAHKWLWLATLDWSEEKFTDDPNYTSPPEFADNEMAPFNGMRAGAGDGTDRIQMKNHSAGLSAVIKFLVDDSRFGILGIDETYTAIFGGSHTATSALLNAVDALVTEWWPDFFRSYIGGEIYGVSKEIFTKNDNLSGNWSIDSEDDTNHMFTGSYPDLSAKLYMVNMNYSSIDENAYMEVELTGHVGTQEPLGVMVFGVDTNSLQYWDHSISQGSTSLQITGLRDLYNAGWRQILVVGICCNVSDTYLQTTDADLQIGIIVDEEPEEPVGLEWNTGLVQIQSILGHFKRDYHDPLTPDVYFDDTFSESSILFRGSFTGGEFIGGCDYISPGGTHYVGSVRAVLVGNPPNLMTEFDWTETKTWDDNSLTTTLRLVDVPFTSFGEYGQVMVFSGEAGYYIEVLEQTASYTYYDVILDDWDSTSSSDISLEFRTE